MAHTIVAQATASGLAGLAVIRVSGEDAFEIVEQCFQGKKKISDAKTHTILYGNFISYTTPKVVLDDVTISVFRSPHSYTGENTVEIGTHSGIVVPMQVINALIDAGAMHAQPGEFTRRAFINGKINLVQAEAIADIIHSISVPSAAISARQLHGGLANKFEELRNKLLEIASLLELEMDFSEEEIPIIDSNEIKDCLENTINICKKIIASYKSSIILRDGFQIAIIGKPNAGKSTLFNVLLNQNRAIVSNIPGTTRDLISENIILNDIPIKIIDTAGLRETDDIIEIEGIKFANTALETANLVLLVIGEEISDDNKNFIDSIINNYPNTMVLVVFNKCDIIDYPTTHYKLQIKISAKNRIGISELQKLLENLISNASQNSNDLLLNARQYYKLVEIEKAMSSALEQLTSNSLSEIIAIDIRNAGNLLGDLTGQTWNNEVLENIFSNFCIGK